LRIALVSPPLLPVPPLRYGGVERVVAVLADGLHARGHDVALVAPGDSTARGRLLPTVERGLWGDGFSPEPAPHFARTLDVVVEHASEFDIIHSHLDQYGFAIATRTAVPLLSTLHGRTDSDPLAAALASNGDTPLVAISASQRGFAPNANWLATIHHGLPLATSALGDGSGGYLLFVGRLSPDKGVDETVEAARLARQRLVVAAKALAPVELAEYADYVEPAVREGRVEFLGEVDGDQRDALYARASATLVLSRWPEPFGLVAIESLAAGTPVIARRSGALPEIVEDGIDGFVVDNAAEAAARVPDVDRLDRAVIRQRALARFGAERMVRDYEAVYMRLLG
jgi:glycosyltransferase involved in cell wall biosynthesis